MTNTRDPTNYNTSNHIFTCKHTQQTTIFHSYINFKPLFNSQYNSTFLSIKHNIFSLIQKKKKKHNNNFLHIYNIYNIIYKYSRDNIKRIKSKPSFRSQATKKNPFKRNPRPKGQSKAPFFTTLLLPQLIPHILNHINHSITANIPKIHQRPSAAIELPLLQP